jgi:hypothetical protein
MFRKMILKIPSCNIWVHLKVRKRGKALRQQFSVFIKALRNRGLVKQAMPPQDGSGGNK